jgi:class 3 adenylate cyclase
VSAAQGSYVDGVPGDSAGQITPEDLHKAGVYDPDAPDAADRLTALELLVQHGAALDDLRAELPDYGALAARLALQPGPAQLTRPELAERVGLPEETVRRLWLGAGFADPGPDLPIATEADAAIFQGFAAAVSLFGEETALQLTRVVGAAMAKVADAIVSAFVTDVSPRAMASDPTGLALVRANLESASYMPFLVSAMDQLLRMHLVAASRTSADVEFGYETQHLVVGFVDLVGSTAFSEQVDVAGLGAALGEFETTASDVVVAAGGRVVKLIGDEIMFVATSIDAACAIALDLADVFRAHPVLPPIRAGLAVGDVLVQGGDCFGPVVSLAARAVKEAQASEVLVDPALQAALPGRYRMAARSEQSLKGFASPIALGSLTRR